MRRTATAFACLIFSSGAFSAPTYSQMLEGSAAYCGFVGTQALNEASEYQKKYGQGSNQYQGQVAKSFKISSGCVDAEKAKLRSGLKAEIAQHPNSSQAIKDAYASWIAYMDWLRTPRLSGEESMEKTTFEAKLNALNAEMDSM